MILATSPLDDFLAGAGESSATGELLQEIGLVGSLLGLTIGGGLIVFLAAVHRGTQYEVGLILRIIAACGAILLVGAVVEIAGQASIDDVGWSDAFTASAAAAPMMRLLGGLLVLLGLFEHTLPDGEGRVRWVLASASAFGYVGVAIAVLSFSFDGHTVTEGPRVLHALSNVVHVSAGGVWAGGVVGLCVVAWQRRGHGSTAELLLRFSSIAGVALVVVALAGALMTLMIIDGFSTITGSAWGRLLITKTVVVGVAAALGGLNHFVVVPALAADDPNHTAEVRARRAVTIESVVLLAVIVITAWFSVASAN